MYDAISASATTAVTLGEVNAVAALECGRQACKLVLGHTDDQAKDSHCTRTPSSSWKPEPGEPQSQPQLRNHQGAAS